MFFPLEIYNPALVTSRFGNRSNPLGSGSQFHNGIDYAAPNDTPVYAPASGTIRDVWNDQRGGNQMRIKHDNGFTTGYAHLNKIRKQAGQRVKAGELVGLTGSTGIVTGAHLHLTVRDAADNLLDPLAIQWKQGVKKQKIKRAAIGLIALAGLIGLIYYTRKK